MRNSLFVVLCTLFVFACNKAQEQPTSTTQAPAPAASAAPATEAQAAPVQQPAASASAASAPVASAPVAGAQETNWKGITAAITEFRRKGNTLTAKIRLTNTGSTASEPDIHYNENYLIDTAAGKKYEVLKDEKSTYIAGLRSGWSNRWYENIPPGESRVIWMKFPAPPPEVKTITLQIQGIPPFEDVAIQD